MLWCSILPSGTCNFNVKTITENGVLNKINASQARMNLFRDEYIEIQHAYCCLAVMLVVIRYLSFSSHSSFLSQEASTIIEGGQTTTVIA